MIDDITMFYKRHGFRSRILNKGWAYRSRILNADQVSDFELGIIYKEERGLGFWTELKGVKKKVFTGGKGGRWVSENERNYKRLGYCL